MSDIYREGHRQLQDRFDTRRLANRLDEAIAPDEILPSDKDFIERLEVPGWKKGGWVADTLPADDPSRDPSREVIDR